VNLESVPGVGAKTAAALRELDDPEGALERGDVAALAAAPGVSPGRATRIARAAIRERHDDPGGFLATERAREVHEALLGLLRERAVTDYAERWVETLYPSGVDSRVAEAQAFARAAMKREPDPEVAEALSGVETLAEPGDVRVRDRCVATTDAERHAAAREALPEVSVEIVDDARDLAELARGYATVVALDEEFAGLDVEGDVRVEPDALDRPVEVVPERPLAFFAANRETLLAAARVHRAADSVAPLDLDRLADALAELGDDGEVAGDAELDRLNGALEELDAAVAAGESVAEDRLRAAIRERDVTIEGADLLSLVERGAGVDSLLSRELAEEYDAAVAAAVDRVVDALDLQEAETLARGLFPDEPTYPVEADEETVTRLRERLRDSRDRRAASRKRELAGELAELRGDAEALVRGALELDAELAVARFARDFDCTMPERGGTGFAIEGGRSPLLEESREAVEPVDYGVEGVALLSGVNSGGKTATLDLVAATAVLAHMGLPVPADRARVPAVEELHYHAKSQGTLDAGALESTLRQFAGLTDGDRVKLVLVDELESITEPGASAKIVAGILEALHEAGATAVFVSHLAGEVRTACGFDVTVDGIRALGLEDGELVVDRSPVKNHLARSTPELIVEKLARDDTPFYDRLLGKFTDSEKD
jgi:dsDNA-specific endonuclease/ATPase MutS2